MKRRLFETIFLVALVLCIAIPAYAYAPFTPEQIGIMGDSGVSSGVHLHISASTSSEFETTFDPLYLMP